MWLHKTSEASWEWDEKSKQETERWGVRKNNNASLKE